MLTQMYVAIWHLYTTMIQPQWCWIFLEKKAPACWGIQLQSSHAWQQSQFCCLHLCQWPLSTYLMLSNWTMSHDPIFITGTRVRLRVSGNDRLFLCGFEFGPNSEIPASPRVLTRPGPDEHGPPLAHHGQCTKYKHNIGCGLTILLYFIEALTSMACILSFAIWI